MGKERLRDVDDGQLQEFAVLTLTNAVAEMKVQLEAMWARLELLESDRMIKPKPSAEDSGIDLGKMP